MTQQEYRDIANDMAEASRSIATCLLDLNVDDGKNSELIKALNDARIAAIAAKFAAYELSIEPGLDS